MYQNISAFSDEFLGKFKFYLSNKFSDPPNHFILQLFGIKGKTKTNNHSL